MRERREGEPWLTWAQECCTETRAELALSPAEWEARFGRQHPGPGYTKTLKVQLDRLIRDVLRTVLEAEKKK